MKSALLNTVRREIGRLSSRPIYLAGILLVPICMVAFFIGILSPGLPLKVPAAVVDQDHSQMSRSVVRSLNATELIDVVDKPMEYNEAMQKVQSGEIMGFFVIPENFEADAVAGRGPVLTYYYNLSIYVPGTLMFKGFKTVGVTATGALAETNLVDKGAPESLVGVVLQPLTVSTHPLGNPWLNYSYYLCPSFLYGVLELMIFLMTAFAITQEIKLGISPQWLATAGGRIGTAIIGKLLPQTVMFSILGIATNVLLYRYLHFPMNGSELWMNLGMVLFVIASQSFAVIICAVLPNPRLALSINSLVGILAFSVAAFSFPVEAMYGAVSIFANILPVRWYFLIYGDLALNGYPLYFARFYFIYLLIFPMLATVAAPLMKRMLARPVYVP